MLDAGRRITRARARLGKQAAMDAANEVSLSVRLQVFIMVFASGEVGMGGTLVIGLSLEKRFF
ncbi:hypothetical protein [Variovorax sp. PDC80]|jgi:hypothetical protein|uniref:hypothetical protein n=1 Tax=Variovorax sp. PDC80 TaxID=1882827 RepID=UPI001160DCAC|nr:hypothetical protein [Variovorax sp. PDC80]